MDVKKHMKNIRVDKGEIGMDTHFHHNGPHKRAENAISVGGLEPAKNNRGITVNAQNCPCDEAVDSRAHRVRECKLYREEWDVLDGEM